LSDLRESLSLNFEKALRMASAGHRDQVRKGSGIPYIEHPFAVAMILDRAGFDEDVVIAGLLHDLVEDTDVTLDQVREGFGAQVAEMVSFCSEEKLDAEGRKRPWIDRKRDHLEAVLQASELARAIVLADKLHNLISIRLDLLEGRAVWECFNADREQVLWYYRSMIDACRSDDTRLIRLTDDCLALLAEVASLH
jgi:(p)ppGpp synthase/HD superfamily hydrolase